MCKASSMFVCVVFLSAPGAKLKTQQTRQIQEMSLLHHKQSHNCQYKIFETTTPDITLKPNEHPYFKVTFRGNHGTLDCKPYLTLPNPNSFTQGLFPFNLSWITKSLDSWLQELCFAGGWTLIPDLPPKKQWRNIGKHPHSPKRKWQWGY